MRSASYALRLVGGELAHDPVACGKSAMQIPSDDGSILGLLHRTMDGAAESWFLIACSSRVGINGKTPALPLAAIELGDLLTIGERGWMISTLWKPEPVAAPAELRNRPCPVCGGELGFAPVVQCACGRWSHLENPSDTDDPNALNCFLKAGLCGECGRRASLEPQIIPDVPASLIDAELDSND
jgi:hypothetical protein